MILKALQLVLVAALPLFALAAFPICLIQNPGFANCDPGQSSSTYSGFDVDLIRYVASISNWTELVGFPPYNDNTSVYSRRFYFICATFRVAPLINILVGNNTMDSCAMGAGALTITASRWRQGVIFSYPFFRTGLGVMISAQPQVVSYNPWAFLLPFHWSIWAALAITLLLVPMLVWLVENLVRTGSIPFHRDSLEDIGFAIYTTVLTVFNLEVVSLLTLPAQAIIVCFCFLNLVMVATYTANLAAKLTTSVQTVGFQTVSDLQGTSVAAHGPYQQRLATNENLNTIGLNWNGSSTFLQVSDMIRGKSISAYIFDYPILLYWKNFYDTACQLTFLPEIEPFDYGIMFNNIFPIDIIAEFNIGVLTAQGSAKLAQLEDKYVSVSSVCGAPGASGVSENTLVFFQVSGLWIILGSAVGFGILISIYRIIRVHCFHGAASDPEHLGHHSSFRRGLSFRMTRLAAEAFDNPRQSPMGSKQVWPGESQLMDPEAIADKYDNSSPGAIDQAPSGIPPLSPDHIAIDTTMGSGDPNSSGLTLGPPETAARQSNTKTLSGPPGKGSMTRSSLLYGTLANSFRNFSVAAKDLASKVLVDPNENVYARGNPRMQEDYSVRQGRMQEDYSVRHARSSRSARYGDAGMSEMSEDAPGSFGGESPFDRVLSGRHLNLASQTTAAGSPKRNSYSIPLLPTASGGSVKLPGVPETQVDPSPDSISLSMPPQGLPPLGLPPQGLPPLGLPPLSIPHQGLPPQHMGDGRSSLPHSYSTERMNFYRPRAAAKLAERGSQRGPGSGSKLSNLNSGS